MSASTPTTRTATGKPPATARALRIVAAVEAVSWLVLIVATIVKYATDPHKQLGVQIMGPVHGVLFIAYVLLVLEVRRHIPWNARTTLIVLAESIIPGGGFVAARRADLR